jgi:hypothetical protein
MEHPLQMQWMQPQQQDEIQQIKQIWEQVCMLEQQLQQHETQRW